MIKNFKCKHTQALFEGKCPKQYRAFQSQAERKLQMINKSQDVKDLLQPPGNHLEKLSGDRFGQYSIRINNKWRVCFEWIDNHAEQVEIVDYH